MILSVITKPRGEPPGVGHCWAIYVSARSTALPNRGVVGAGGSLLGALQIGTLAGVHPDFLTLGDELGHLDRHPVRELGGLGARRFRGPAHDRRGLHDGEL